jgi:hypothetical protein
MIRQRAGVRPCSACPRTPVAKCYPGVRAEGRPPRRCHRSPADQHLSSAAPARSPLPDAGRDKIMTDTPHASRAYAIRGDRFVNVTPDARAMGRKRSSEYRATQRDRERRRRQEQERSTARQRQLLDPAPREGDSSGTARRAAATTCGWCFGPITPRPRGPIPKWCSATCRHRAWEQSRAAASGRSAIEVVERVVTVHAVTGEPARGPRQHAWVDLLQELTAQVDSGTVYDRHLAAISAALDDVVRAVLRRSGHSSRPPSPRPWG